MTHFRELALDTVYAVDGVDEENQNEDKRDLRQRQGISSHHRQTAAVGGGIAPSCHIEVSR
jgi:hypothetical protein